MKLGYALNFDRFVSILLVVSPQPRKGHTVAWEEYKFENEKFILPLFVPNWQKLINLQLNIVISVSTSRNRASTESTVESTQQSSYLYFILWWNHFTSLYRSLKCK